MGSRVALVLAFVLSCFVSCADDESDDVRQRGWVDAHPELSNDVRRAILAGDLVPEIGMTRDDVLASIGEPDRKETVEPPHVLYPAFERWVYESRDQVAVFQEGVLVTVYRLSIVRDPETGAALGRHARRKRA